MSSDKGKPIKKDGRIVTMDSVRRSQEEGQAYYAGSGQQIVGGDGTALAAALRRAALSEDFEERSDPVGSSFSGLGRRLDEEGSQQEVQPASASPNQAGASRVVLTMWKDGYTVDEGPLHSYDDVSCDSLMEGLARGELPSEIMPSGSGNFGSPVNLTVVDNRPQTFTQTVRIFGGSGQKLGSTQSASDQRTSREETTPQVNENSTNRSFFVVENDDTQVTNPIVVKIRLPDGKVIPIKLTAHSLVSDLRLRVIQIIPSLIDTVFSLHSIYPRRALTDEEPVQPNALFILTI